MVKKDSTFTPFLFLLILASAYTYWIHWVVELPAGTAQAFFAPHSFRPLLEQGISLLLIPAWVAFLVWTGYWRCERVFLWVTGAFSATFFLLAIGFFFFFAPEGESLVLQRFLPEAFESSQGLMQLFRLLQSFSLLLVPFLSWALINTYSSWETASRNYPWYGMGWVLASMAFSVLGALWVQSPYFSMEGDPGVRFGVSALGLSVLSLLLFCWVWRLRPRLVLEEKAEARFIGSRRFWWLTLFVLSLTIVVGIANISFGWATGPGPFDLILVTKRAAFVRIFLEKAVLEEVGSLVFFALLIWRLPISPNTVWKVWVLGVVTALGVACLGLLMPALGRLLLPLYLILFALLFTTHIGTSLVLVFRNMLYTSVPQGQRFQAMWIEFSLFQFGQWLLKGVGMIAMIQASWFFLVLLVLGVVGVWITVLSKSLPFEQGRIE